LCQINRDWGCHIICDWRQISAQIGNSGDARKSGDGLQEFEADFSKPSMSLAAVLRRKSIRGNGGTSNRCGRLEYDGDEISPAQEDLMPQVFPAQDSCAASRVEMRDPNFQYKVEMSLIERNQQVQAFAAQRPLAR
jgi:hypothetical protein